MGVVKKPAFSMKNGRFFREERFESTVGGGLRIVGLDLAEVGLYGGVENKAVFEDDLGIEPHLTFEVLALVTGTRWCREDRERDSRAKETWGVNCMLRPGEISSSPSSFPSWFIRPSTLAEY